MGRTVSMTVILRPEEPAAASGDWLRLEQEPWPSEHPGGFTGWLADQGRTVDVWSAWDAYAEYQAGCNGKGKIETTIHVFTSRPGLAYSMATSAGELSGPKRVWSDLTKEVAVDLETGIDLARDGFSSITSAAWAGPVFDEAGRKIAPPAVSWSSTVLAVAGKAIGTLAVTGRSRRDDWTLTMDAGRTAEVMAVHSGRVERLTVRPPRASGCSGGVSFSVDGQGKQEKQEKCVKRVIEADLCTGEVLSDTLEPVACSEP